MTLAIPDSTTASRRHRERSARRQAILSAAIAVFGEKGFAEATMDEIAERAEFGKGTLYNYFEDKQALLLATFESAYDGLVALVEDYFADPSVESLVASDPRAAFHGFISFLTSFFRDHHAVFVVMTREAHRLAFDGEADHVGYFRRQSDRVAEALVPPLERAMQHGRMRRLPAKHVAHLVVGNIHIHLMNAVCGTPAQADLPRDTADLISSVLFDGLLADTP